MNWVYRLEGAIVPKARPRVSDNRAYLPPHYADWKERARDSLRFQHYGQAIAVPVALDVVLIGKHSRKCDGDNVLGSIADALVQAGVLLDDNLLKIPAKSIRLFYSREAAIALIQLTEIQDVSLPDWATKQMQSIEK